MNAYMTKGTYDFLYKLKAKHPKISFYFMGNQTGTLAYYESEQKSVFAAGDHFTIIATHNTLDTEGCTVMRHIPIADDGMAQFEESMKHHLDRFKQTNGLQAYRFLKPKKGNTYIVLTQWQTADDSKQLEEMDSFFQQAGKPTAYPLDQPFSTTFTMINE